MFAPLALVCGTDVEYGGAVIPAGQQYTLLGSIQESERAGMRVCQQGVLLRPANQDQNRCMMYQVLVRR